MGNYADSRDAGTFDKNNGSSSKSNDMGQTAEQIYDARGGYSGTVMSLNDFKNSGDLNPSSSVGTTSVRRRGSSEQTRVGNDTRVRDDSSSGTAGAEGNTMGKAMAESSGSPVGQPAQGGGLWQATRQPTELASIQQRVLQSLTNPVKRGM